MNWHIKMAAMTVSHGGVIAYPTEAVYGLGCSPWDVSSVYQILKLKRRDIKKGLIVIASELQQLDSLVYFPVGSIGNEIFASWPGPLTWILPARENVPQWLTGGRRGLAVRISNHTLVQALCHETGPLVSTSANPAGAMPARTPLRVRTYFQNRLDYILPGNVDHHAKPSQIKDAMTGEIIRILN